MNIERSLSQVNKEDSARSDFSSAVVRGGEGGLSVQHILSKK